MAQDIGGALIVLMILGTFVVNLYYASVAIYRRRWLFAAMVGGLFALYLLALVFSFLFAVGLCAAGCPPGLDSLLGLLYLGLSGGLVLWLRKLHQRPIGSTITSDSNTTSDST